MNRRFFLKQMLAFCAIPFVRRAWAETPVPAGAAPLAGHVAFAGVERIKKSPEAWQRLLSPEAYGVLFKENTERSFSSPYNEEHRVGTFLCAACYNPLFSSDMKFDSGTGWPSFFRAIEGHTETKLDFKLILPRTEYHCMRCGGHQGHRFNDGPPPTGQRWCNNGVALLFIPKGEPVPALRT